MIKINKLLSAVPEILTTAGVAETNSNNILFNQGTRQFIFNKKIYGHSSVKKLLIQIQHDKCCFCERNISAGEHGHIEHFRPKGGYKKDDNSRLIKPGYYWLAYEFENLYLSCTQCNTSYKKNYFPLTDETTRAKNHNENIANEDSLIINPADDPSLYLVFNKEIIKPKKNNLKGKETIKRTGLNRKALADDRLQYLKVLKFAAVIARGNGPDSQEAKDLFKKIGKNESIFSYMVVCNYPDLV